MTIALGSNGGDVDNMTEDTYIRAKLTEINGAIERLTDMLNRMIEVMSKIQEVQDSNSDIAIVVAANSEKLDELKQIVKNISAAPMDSSSPATLADKGAVSGLSAVLDTLETQIRDGVIASDLAQKINEAASMLEERGVTGAVLVKMNRWTRILRTYGRVDTISPQDLGKLRTDLKEWNRDISTRK